jgi:thiol-disulfide isomerase/thioredoxin
MTELTRIVDVENIHILDNVGYYPRVVNYSASWCKPCKNIAKDMDNFSISFENIYFFKVDIDSHKEHVESMNINSVPTFMFYINVLSQPKIVMGTNLTEIKKILENMNSGVNLKKCAHYNK